LPKDCKTGIVNAVKPPKGAEEAAYGKPGDVALFGRMMAVLPTGNVDAAVQVAHAIGINTLQQEFDFFTAVDDLGASDDQGSAHMGETGYNSSAYYRFATLNTQQLIDNLGSQEEAPIVAKAFAQAFVKAIPSGYQNSFAAHSLPALVLMLVRQGQPVSLVDAFENPVRPSGGMSLLEKAVKELDQHWVDMVKMYGRSDVNYFGIVTRSRLAEHLNALKSNQVASTDELISQVVATAFNVKPIAGAA
jgi:CRISPR system Cascade subunit CasC